MQLEISHRLAAGARLIARPALLDDTDDHLFYSEGVNISPSQTTNNAVCRVFPGRPLRAVRLGRVRR